MNATLSFAHTRSALLAAAFLLTSCASGPSLQTAQEMTALTPSTPAFVESDILGETAQDIDAILGEPALTRREGPGEFRRYSLSTCSLIVILYPDESGVMRSQHADAAALRSADEKPDLASCLAAG